VEGKGLLDFALHPEFRRALIIAYFIVIYIKALLHPTK
jgi:hypothetical protein